MQGDPEAAHQAARDYTLEWNMVPMRDGVSLRTAVLRPKGEAGPLPILLYRTPYLVDFDLSVTRLEALRGPGMREFSTGHIQVFQQVRGRGGSEGRLVLRQPLRGPLNDGPTDEVTDTYDATDWAVSHVSGNNGRVAMMGVSYSAWLVLAAKLDPHPALRAVIATAPEIDWWRGDDDFRNGAFRLGNSFEYVYGMETDSAAVFTHFPYGSSDLYRWWLDHGAAADVATCFGPDSHFRKLVAHPDYDEFWRGQALDRLLAASPARHVPTMYVQCLFDSYDPYGAQAAFAATRANDAEAQDVFVAGPWDHGQNLRDQGDRLGPLQWDQPTALDWRRKAARPFLDRHLRDALLPEAREPVRAFDTGLGRWTDDGVFTAGAMTPLHVAADRRLTWRAPEEAGVHEYISDPASPVPFRSRPIAPFYRSATGGFPAVGDATRGFGEWLVDDQRFVDGRPDVLSLVTAPLDHDLTIRGRPTAVLRAITSGEDCDWVVKLIDVFPEDVAGDPELAGYQLMVCSEILRGRYRDSPEEPAPIPPGVACDYRFDLSYAAHTFRAGHRIMVQIQSSWFPLHDRNPQRYVPVMSARPQDFQAARQTILFGPEDSRVLLPVLGQAEGC